VVSDLTVTREVNVRVWKDEKPNTEKCQVQGRNRPVDLTSSSCKGIQGKQNSLRGGCRIRRISVISGQLCDREGYLMVDREIPLLRLWGSISFHERGGLLS